MKILFINTLYYPTVLGGAELSLQTLAESLVNNGDDVVVICVSNNKKKFKDQINGCNVYYVDLINLYNPFSSNTKYSFLKPLWNVLDTYNPFMAKQIGRILDFECPDIVHTNNLACFSVAVWSEIKKRKLPLVHTLRDYYLICPRSTMFNNNKNCSSQCFFCRAYAIIRKIMSDYVDAVVGNSRFILNQHLIRGYFKKNKINKVIFSAYKGEKSNNTKSHQGSSAFRLGFLGRLKPNKGIELLLNIANQICNENIEFWIGGRDECSLETRNKLKNVHFMGFVDPISFFSNIDLLIVPSIWHDPLPRTILEAYAHGIPVIGTNRGGIPEIIDHKATGFIFDPDYPNIILPMIKTLQQNTELLNQMKKNALIKSRDFSIERSLTNYRNLYSNLIFP